MADETLRPDTGSDVEPESRLGRKLLTVALVAVLLVAAYVFAVSVLPRWWAQQVGDQVVFDGLTVQGKMCIHALYSLLPKVFAMRYGAEFPWLEDPDVATHACPDAWNPVGFEVRRVRDG